MTESFGLAGMTEVPAAMVDVQRRGPSAGQPTKHEHKTRRQAYPRGYGRE